MAHPFRFSSQPNRAQDIHWRTWSQETFAYAGSADRPILLCLTAVWCHWCQQMDETTYSDPSVITRINDHFVPIRVDADQYPHVHDRYIAGGWPTNAFLTPTGEVLWAGTYITAENFMAVAEGVRSAWSERRSELALEIERRRKALEAARGRVSTIGIVRREAADDVWSALLDTFDSRNGGFGSAPKYPTPDAIELLFVKTGGKDPAAASMAAQTLDGMLAGELWDNVEGGFFRYAHGADWTAPQTEKLLAVNAGLLRAYALGAQLQNRNDWRVIAQRLVKWADETLPLDGLWSASQSAAPEYYQTEPRDRSRLPAVDSVLYTSASAQWIRALADAGGRLQMPEWVASAERALESLQTDMRAPNELLHHFRETAEEPQLSSLLIDVLEVARACIAVAQAAGRADLLRQAHHYISVIEKKFWADEGGFYDRIRTPHDVGVLRYRDRPFDSNADMARLLIELVLALGERSYRALAERTLALLSPAAGRYSVGGSGFALAVHEFFEPPTQIFIVGSDSETTRQLRQAALALPLASRRVWPLPGGGRVGTQNFTVKEPGAAYVVGPRGNSAAITSPGALAEAVASVNG